MWIKNVMKVVTNVKNVVHDGIDEESNVRRTCDSKHTGQEIKLIFPVD